LKPQRKLNDIKYLLFFFIALTGIMGLVFISFYFSRGFDEFFPAVEQGNISRRILSLYP